MKFFDTKDYIPYMHELSNKELGYNVVDDTLFTKINSNEIISVLPTTSGGSDNNKWIKFPGGVLMCMGKGSGVFDKVLSNAFGTTSGDINIANGEIEFSKQFIGLPNVFVNPINVTATPGIKVNSVYTLVDQTSLTEYGCTVKVMYLSGSALFSWLAIGKWE